MILTILINEIKEYFTNLLEDVIWENSLAITNLVMMIIINIYLVDNK